MTDENLQGRYIIKAPDGDSCCMYEIIADAVQIITVINVSKFIDFFDILPSRRIYYIRPFIFRFSGNIFDRTAGKEKIIILTAFPSFCLLDCSILFYLPTACR